MSHRREELLRVIGEGLSQFSSPELHLFTLAVLHGVPITRLEGSPEVNVDLLVGSQKKLRKFMSEAGFGVADVEKKMGEKSR